MRCIARLRALAAVAGLALPHDRANRRHRQVEAEGPGGGRQFEAIAVSGHLPVAQPPAVLGGAGQAQRAAGEAFGLVEDASFDVAQRQVGHPDRIGAPGRLRARRAVELEAEQGELEAPAPASGALEVAGEIPPLVAIAGMRGVVGGKGKGARSRDLPEALRRVVEQAAGAQPPVRGGLRARLPAQPGDQGQGDGGECQQVAAHHSAFSSGAGSRRPIRQAG